MQLTLKKRRILCIVCSLISALVIPPRFKHEGTRMKKPLSILAIILLSSQLSACFTAVIGGAAAGGTLANDRRTSGIYIEDENIELKTGNRLRTYLDTFSHVNVTSYNRIVLLTGEVPNEAQRTRAEMLTREIENVREIHNALVVGAASSFASRSQDVLLTSKVKANLIGEEHFPSTAIKVVSEAGTVFLMGLVSKQEADKAVEIARTTAGVSKVVKVFEYTH